MIRAFVFALDPTSSQEEALRSHCGAARFAYNHMLAAVKANLDQRAAEKSYGLTGDELTPSVGWSAYSLRKTWNTQKDTSAPWWAENSKEAYASGCANLAAALKNWAESKSGARSGRKVGFPGFKSRRHAMSCTFTTGVIRVDASRHHLTLPRLGRIHTHESTRDLARRIENGTARITQATISRRRGRWVVSLLAHVETPARAHARPGSVVGVDLGVKDLLVAATPSGREILRVPVPAQLRSIETRKADLQRRNRRRRAPRKGVAPSNRWRKAQTRIDRLDWRAANIREHTLHQATTTLARSFETVVVENLNVTGMATRGGAYKTGLNRSIHRAAISTSSRFLGYKATTLVRADRFYPSSKTCSGCGAVKAKLALSERTFICHACGLMIDRDLNAAVNLAQLAGSGPVTGRGATHKTLAPSGAKAAGYETSTHPRGPRAGNGALVEQK